MKICNAELSCAHYLADCSDKSVDILTCVVEGESRSDTHLIAQSSQRWLGAVVTCSDGYALLVQEFARFWHRYAIEDKRDDADPMLGVAKDGETGDERQLLTGILCEQMLVVLNVADADAADVVESCTKAYGICHIGRASLEASRRIIIFRALYGHVLYHVASALPWLHAVENLLLAIDDTDAVRPIYLVSAEDEEVCIESLYVDRSVSYGLCSVDEHWHVVRMSYVDDAFHIIDSAEGVVDMSHTDETRARCDETLQFGENEVAVLVDGDGL